MQGAEEMTAPTEVVPPVTAPEEFKAIPLTLMDRCDRCGAQAFVRASIPTNGKLVDLLFCNHHFRKYEAKLTEVAMHIQDDSDAINTKASASSGTAADDR